MADKPPCHGKFWQAVEGTPLCEKCGARNDCLAEFVRGPLAKSRSALDDPTPENLSNVTGVCVEAILVALQFQRNSGLGTEEPPPSSEPVVDPNPTPEPVKAPAPETGSKPGPSRKRAAVWDPRHDATRWERERTRSPLIARLTPGMVLRREHKDVRYEVKVVSDGYSYDDTKYPTLYSVTKAITGATAWSAARFFNLAKLLEKRDD